MRGIFREDWRAQRRHRSCPATSSPSSAVGLAQAVRVGVRARGPARAHTAYHSRYSTAFHRNYCAGHPAPLGAQPACLDESSLPGLPRGASSPRHTQGCTVPSLLSVRSQGRDLKSPIGPLRAPEDRGRLYLSVSRCWITARSASSSPPRTINIFTSTIAVPCAANAAVGSTC